MVLNMCNEGKFGTITHGEAAYIHEMRDSLLGPKAGVQPNWRRKAITSNDGNLYPTHGLGPVSWYMGINKGDVFEKMVSMSSPSAALTERRDDTTEEADPRRQEDYVCGDMNTMAVGRDGSDAAACESSTPHHCRHILLPKCQFRIAQT